MCVQSAQVGKRHEDGPRLGFPPWKFAARIRYKFNNSHVLLIYIYFEVVIDNYYLCHGACSSFRRRKREAGM